LTPPKRRFAAIAPDNKTNVLNKLYATDKNGATPLQKGLKWVGDYYENGKAGIGNAPPPFSAPRQEGGVRSTTLSS